MATGPNKNNSSSENNENRPLSPGDSSRTIHISPPLPGSQSNILLGPSAHRTHEDMMRRIVSEEIQVREELGKRSHYNLPPTSLPLPDQYIQARYKLQFINKVQDPTYTTDLVRDEIGVPIRVEIYDSYTRSRVSPDRFLSSAKVQLVVVDAEYWKNRVTWSRSEFVQNVLREREGKRPILTGRSLIIQLTNGVGTFINIVFNDNSSWTKSGFRLVVVFKGEGEEGYLNGERVQEGVSEPFRVKDCRGKASKKPDRLELTHNVRCIKKIGKGRASSLQKKDINIVENFLELYYNNQSELREMLGIKSESGKEWESMIEHVMQCADEYKKKCIASNNSSQPRQVPIIEGDVSASNRQHVPISNFSWMNLPRQPISAGTMVQYIGERHNASSDGGNYGGGGGGTYGVSDNYGGDSGGIGCGIDGDTYGGGDGIGNYGGGGGGIGGGIDGGTYGGGGVGTYGGSGIGNYGGGGIGNYGGSGGDIGNYGGGSSIGNYNGCGGGGGGIDNYGGDGIGNYGGGGGGIGNCGGCGGGIDNYGGGGGGIGNYGGSGGGGIGIYGGGGIGNYGGGGIGNYGGSDGGSGYYGGNYCGGGGGGGGGNYSGNGGDIDGGSGIDNYNDGGNYGGSGNYSNGGGGGNGGGDWFGRSFSGREGGMAVSGLEGLSLEGSQIGG